jgi:hypothetical protein
MKKFSNFGCIRNGKEYQFFATSDELKEKCVCGNNAFNVEFFVEKDSQGRFILCKECALEKLEKIAV